MAWLRAFALFALLVAVPFLVEELLGKHPRMPIGPIKVSDSFWHDLLSYGLPAIVLLPLLILLIVLILFLPQTFQIAEWLTLAEREMNSLLRQWGGGYESRKNVVKERAEWLSMIPDTDDPAPFADIYKNFFDLNQQDLTSGGSQGAAMGKVRMTAFLLRELYEGNVKNAQIKIFNEFANGGKPYIAPGIRQIVGYDGFKSDIKPNDPDYDKYEYGFRKGAGVDWFPLVFTVWRYGFPRNIVMIRSDKSKVYNRDVIEELNVQVAPAADEPGERDVPKLWLRLLESRDSLSLFFRWLAYLLLVALTVYLVWRLFWA